MKRYKNMSNKIKYGLLRDPDLGMCPSCHKVMALTRATNLDKLYRCPECKASSYAYKWLSDKGKSAAEKMRKLYDAIGEEEVQVNSKVEEVQTENT